MAPTDTDISWRRISISQIDVDQATRNRVEMCTPLVDSQYEWHLLFAHPIIVTPSTEKRFNLVAGIRTFYCAKSWIMQAHNIPMLVITSVTKDFVQSFTEFDDWGGALSLYGDDLSPAARNRYRRAYKASFNDAVKSKRMLINDKGTERTQKRFITLGNRRDGN